MTCWVGRIHAWGCRLRIRAALHVHSTLSHDGTLTVTEVANWYRQHGFHVVGMGEHSQDMTEAKVRRLVEECTENSDERFRMIPGIEFTCDREGMHILGVGCVQLTSDRDPVRVGRHIRQHGGFSVLAHPRRFGWQCDREILHYLDAVEIWNLAYDGKYLPWAHAPAAFQRMRQVNPRLLALACHDLHRKVSFYDLAVTAEVNEISCAAVLTKLRLGEYRMKSRFFSAGSDANLSRFQSAALRLASGRLDDIRQMCARMERFR